MVAAVAGRSLASHCVVAVIRGAITASIGISYVYIDRIDFTLDRNIVFNSIVTATLISNTEYWLLHPKLYLLTPDPIYSSTENQSDPCHPCPVP